MVIIIKRDGREKNYDRQRIINAVSKANCEVNGGAHSTLPCCIADKVEAYLEDNCVKTISVEELQDKVVEFLEESDHTVAKAYDDYRRIRELNRSENFAMTLKKQIVDKFSTENSNANVDENNFGGKELRIVEDIEKKMADRTMPKDLVILNDKKILKQHDYAKTVLGTHNCLFIDYPKLLEEGFKTRQADTKKANSYISACQLLAVIIQTQSLDQFGGCGLMNFSLYMVPYLKRTISKCTQTVADILDMDIEIPSEIGFKQARELLGESYSKADKLITKELEQAHQALITNLVTLQSRSGHQLPFSSINLGLIDWDNEEESAIIIESFLNELDKGIGKLDRTAIFPITCFQVKSGVNRHPEDKYYYLRLLAQKVSYHRLYPTMVNCDWSQNKATNWESEMNLMGCRTMVGYNVFTDDYGKLGRGNNVPVTINLPYLALLAKREDVDFFELLDKQLKNAKRSLLIRYGIMIQQKPSVAPFMYSNNTVMGAENCTETVENALKNNTLAIGYIGIAEACKVLVGSYHCETEEARQLGVKIVKTIRDYCDKCTQEEHLNFSTYATPAEGLCEQALNAIVKEFGVIEGVSDKKYLTNSHHCPVELGVNIFKKIEIESEYAKLANGGNIFHYECDGANYNEKALTKVIDYALDNDIPYIRISHPIGTCMDCGYSIGNFMTTCEKCGSHRIENLAIVTGYLTVSYENMNQGKQDEVIHRKKND